MIDRHTVILKGWKFTSNKLKEIDRILDEDMDAWGDNDYILDKFTVSDTMCGDYTYIGAVILNEDNDEEFEFTITEDIVNKKYEEFVKWQQENPKFWDLLRPYCKGEPKLYCFNHIW